MKGQITKTAFSLMMSALGLISLSEVVHAGFFTGLLMTHLAALLFALSAIALPKAANADDCLSPRMMASIRAAAFMNAAVTVICLVVLTPSLLGAEARVSGAEGSLFSISVVLLDVFFSYKFLSFFKAK
jgi:hypothetical protein